LSRAWADEVAHFNISAFQIKGNTLLSEAEVEEAVYPYTGPDRTVKDVEAARAALQAAYEKHGYSTVSVFIPEQGVATGVIRLEVQPQKIGKLTVRGASNPAAIRAAAPSMSEGVVPNIHQVQQDIVILNQYPERRVTPEFVAGQVPGTLDVDLKVEEHSPLHATVELNNQASPETSGLRAVATVRDDDLWGRGDSVSFTAQTAPSHTAEGMVYSGNYSFRIDPSLQLLVYGVRSNSHVAVVGGVDVVGAGDIGGLRVIKTFSPLEGLYQSLTFGFDYKDFQEDTAVGSDRTGAPIKYWPLNASWRTDWIADKARSDLTFSATLGVNGLGDNASQFDFKRYQARPNFSVFHIDGSTTYTQASDLQWYAHLTSQWTDDALISNEQFSLGGTSSVRGYLESEALADYGAALQLELRSPSFARRFGTWANELRVLTFLDGGFGAIHSALAGQDSHWRLASAGVGTRFRVLKYLNGAVDFAAPLTDGPDEHRGAVLTRFRVWGEF
jgi:hemolysin activation/secretion protein